MVVRPTKMYHVDLPRPQISPCRPCIHVAIVQNFIPAVVAISAISEQFLNKAIKMALSILVCETQLKCFFNSRLNRRNNEMCLVASLFERMV